MVYTRLVFSRPFDIRGNLGNVEEKPTRKTGFSRERKRPAPRTYAPTRQNPAWQHFPDTNGAFTVIPSEGDAETRDNM